MDHVEDLPTDATLLTPVTHTELGITDSQDHRVIIEFRDEGDTRPLQRDQFETLMGRIDDHHHNEFELDRLPPDAAPYAAVLSVHPRYEVDETVVEVAAMDRDRTAEIRRTLRELGSKHRFADAVPERGPIDRERLFEAATRADRNLAPRVGALYDRFARSHPSLVRIAFETDEPIGHAAGQYVSLRYGGRTRAYSIASSPTRDETEVCIRRVPDGRLSSRLCEDLSVGDEVTMRGPNGDLLLEDVSGRDLAFLATGTGVAPMKSMIDYTFEEGRDEYRGTERDVWLFLGAAWEDDLPYHEAFEDRAETDNNFHYIPCCSREPWLAEWDGETDYIQDALLKYVDERALEGAAVGRHMAAMLADRPTTPVERRIDPGELEVYACGINAMVYSLETAVQRLGVPDRHVHCEGYG